jgi:hypothetical protein
MRFRTLLTDDTTNAPTPCRLLKEIFSGDERRNDALPFNRVRDRQQIVIASALDRRPALSHHFLIPAGDWRFDRVGDS